MMQVMLVGQWLKEPLKGFSEFQVGIEPMTPVTLVRCIHVGISL